MQSTRVIMIAALLVVACSQRDVLETVDAGNRDGGIDSQIREIDGQADTIIDNDAGAPVRVLFIGNSYTSVNDLPAVVAKLSEASQSPFRFEVGQHAPGGKTWEDHAADPTVDQLIEQSWDYVVLQDQSVQPFIVNEVKDALLSLDAKIETTGAKTILFMTWARSADRKDVNDQTRFRQDMSVSSYYQKHAKAIDARVSPVGRAWERALRDATVTLHASDGSHPNAHGTYLAACVFYATLTEESPVGLGTGGLSVSSQDAARLQQIAWETMTALEQPDLPLVGEWPLSSARTGNDLIVSNGLALGSEVGPQATPSSATQFEGGTFAAVPYFAGMNTANITVAFYAYRSDWSASVATPEYMVGKFQAYEIYQEGTTLYARVRTHDDVSSEALTYAADTLASGWHHIAMTYDGATYALWVDGTDVASATTSGALLYQRLHTDGTPTEQGIFAGISIGGEPHSSDWTVMGVSTFNGALANFRIYETALTAAEIQLL